MFFTCLQGAVLHRPNGIHCRSESETGAHRKIQQLGVPAKSTDLLADEQIHYATIIAEYPSVDAGIIRTGTFPGEDTDDTSKEFRSGDPLTNCSVVQPALRLHPHGSGL